MEYNYGSPPIANYTYRDFVRHLAPKFPQNDEVFRYNDSLQWRNNVGQLPLDLFRNICHWKSPRPFKKRVRRNGQHRVNKQWGSALQKLNETRFSDEGVKTALKLLTELDGVGIPTASALLTAWNPNKFGIIDFRVLNVLGLPKNTSYVVYRRELIRLRSELQLRNCSLRQIEFALWHYYPVKAKDTKERPE